VSGHQITNIPADVPGQQNNRQSQDILAPPACGKPKVIDLEAGDRKLTQQRQTLTPDYRGLVEDPKQVLSMQADIISVLSGHSHSRSGMKYR